MAYLKKIIRRWQESKWLLGICLRGFEDLKEGRIQWISNGKYEGKKWFADPFILSYDEQFVYLLVEEFDYDIHRGRIAKVIIDRRSWTVKDCIILLDLDSHLSFPMIWRQGEDVFVCPENYHSGYWKIYRYNREEETLEYVRQLLHEKLTDATIWQNGNDYFILSTYDPKPNGSELTIWKSSGLMGKYEKCQLIKFDENIGRNAGAIFQYHNRWIRPAQESNYVYGHAISFQEIKHIGLFFYFEEIYRYHSTHPQYNVGAHTYNMYGELAVIDVKGFRFEKKAQLIRTLSKILVMTGLKKRHAFQ